MPRFFFNCEGAQAFIDDRGTDLPDLATARVQAVQNAGEILRDHAQRFAQAASWRVYVMDEAKRTVFSVRLSIDHPVEEGEPCAQRSNDELPDH